MKFNLKKFLKMNKKNELATTILYGFLRSEVTDSLYPSIKSVLNFSDTENEVESNSFSVIRMDDGVIMLRDDTSEEHVSDHTQTRIYIEREDLKYLIELAMEDKYFTIEKLLKSVRIARF